MGTIPSLYFGGATYGTNITPQYSGYLTSTIFDLSEPDTFKSLNEPTSTQQSKPKANKTSQPKASSSKPATKKPSTSSIDARINKVVSWAQSKVGWHEGANNRNPFGAGGKWNNQPWCSHFVSTAFEKNGGSPFGHKARALDILNWGKATDRIVKGTPKKGDIIITRGDGSGHAGIVKKVKNGRVYTIEGNSSDMVSGKNSYSLHDSRVLGYVRPLGDKPGTKSSKKTHNSSKAESKTGSKGKSGSTTKSEDKKSEKSEQPIILTPAGQ
jgi:hypothetical protein